MQALEKTRLGEEFSYRISHSAGIMGEDLGIRFEEVVEDSCYPKNVASGSAGRVSCIVELTDTGSSYGMVLLEPILTGQYTKETHEEYQPTFHVEPYPAVSKNISKGEY